MSHVLLRPLRQSVHDSHCSLSDIPLEDEEKYWSSTTTTDDDNDYVPKLDHYNNTAFKGKGKIRDLHLEVLSDNAIDVDNIETIDQSGLLVDPNNINNTFLYHPYYMHKQKC